MMGATLRLHDEMGRIVATETVKEDTKQLQWNVGHLECGMYSLELLQGENRVVSRVVICD